MVNNNAVFSHDYKHLPYFNQILTRPQSLKQFRKYPVKGFKQISFTAIPQTHPNNGRAI